MDYYNMPDRSKGDYYCQLCDSHMNNDAMWDIHVTGKRHIKNSKKLPGELPSKIKAATIDDLPIALEHFDETDELLVGLEFMSETRRADSSIDPFYKCFLCQGMFTLKTVVEHIISIKHRINYLRKVDPEEAKLIEALNLSDKSLESLVIEKCHIKFLEFGRGKMEVKLEKTKGLLICDGVLIEPDHPSCNINSIKNESQSNSSKNCYRQEKLNSKQRISKTEEPRPQRSLRYARSPSHKRSLSPKYSPPRSPSKTFSTNPYERKSSFRRRSLEKQNSYKESCVLPKKYLIEKPPADSEPEVVWSPDPENRQRAKKKKIPLSTTSNSDVDLSSFKKKLKKGLKRTNSSKEVRNSASSHSSSALNQVQEPFVSSDDADDDEREVDISHVTAAINEVEKKNRASSLSLSEADSNCLRAIIKYINEVKKRTQPALRQSTETDSNYVTAIIEDVEESIRNEGFEAFADPVKMELVKMCFILKYEAMIKKILSGKSSDKKKILLQQFKNIGRGVLNMRGEE